MLLHVSVILSTGGVSRPISRGGWGSGLGGGVLSRPTPREGIQANTRGGGCRGPGQGVYPSMHWGRHLPSSRRLLLRAARILLECILVKDILILLGCPNCEFFGAKAYSQAPSRHHFLNVTFNLFKRYMTLDATFFWNGEINGNDTCE